MTSLLVLCSFVVLLFAAGRLTMKRPPSHPKLVLAGVMLLSVVMLVFSIASAFAAEPSSAEAAIEGSAAGLGFIGAGLSTGLACLGAGIGVAVVGAAALGVVAEKPAMFGSTLVYLGLAEGIAIYGVVISLFIVNKI
ncbi:MAG: ATP synthase subunit C [Synergistaceae bacterium]|jgi:V/A-type H+-transporting ATPase subunit K|nr:ATP synthase subunit C [Synergistaceae bacterium]